MKKQSRTRREELYLPIENNTKFGTAGRNLKDGFKMALEVSGMQKHFTTAHKVLDGNTRANMTSKVVFK